MGGPAIDAVRSHSLEHLRDQAPCIVTRGVEQWDHVADARLMSAEQFASVLDCWSLRSPMKVNDILMGELQ